MDRLFENDNETFKKLGISSVYEWSLADGQRREITESFSSAQEKKEVENERKIKELELELLSMKIPGFFPTPKPLIERLIELAEIKPSHSVLEPSAGKGDILDAIKEEFGDEVSLYACEVNSTLREILNLKRYKLLSSDFLSFEGQLFDRIVMNPPFENGQDADHVSHALRLLKPDGRLVAIMGEGVFFRQFKKDTEFRNLLSRWNAYISEPIQGAFKDGFKQTGVNVRMVAINRDFTPVTTTKQEPRQERNEPQEMELLELLKLRVELERKKNTALSGVRRIDRQKLNELERTAWLKKAKWEVLNFR
jgi:type I restriction-modification system DNA methylase subunit